MPRPHRNRVTDEVMQRISDALERMDHDHSSRRINRELRRATGLGQDVLTLALRRDVEERSTWRLAARLAALTEPKARRRTGRGDDQRAGQDRQVQDLRRQLRQKDSRIAELEATLDRYAMAVLAQHLELVANADRIRDVVTLGHDRERRHT